MWLRTTVTSPDGEVIHRDDCLAYGAERFKGTLADQRTLLGLVKRTYPGINFSAPETFPVIVEPYYG